MSSIKLLTCFFLCQFLFFSTRANNSESPDSKPNERAISDEQAERLFVAQFSDWMENYPQFTDAEYRRRLQAMSQFIDYRLDPMVKERIIVRTEKYRANTERLLGLAAVYFPVFEESLAKYNVPHHLKYLPIIESRLIPNAKSHAGAVGLWQFINSTGKIYGLAINTTQDQRRDTYAASEAAARYLSELYQIYGDWSMALSAYNCGPGRLNRAIKAAGGSKDYWTVRRYLPTETQKYVPYFMAVAYVGEYYYLHELSPTEQNRDLVLTDSLMFYTSQSLYKLAKELDLNYDMVKMLNPGYLKGYVPKSAKGNAVILPCKVVAKLRNYEDTYKHLLSIQQENPLKAIRRINTVKGLDRLAKAFRCTKRDLLYWNDMAEGEKILPNTAIAIRRYLAPKEAKIKKRVYLRAKPIMSLRTLRIDDIAQTTCVLMKNPGSCASAIATLIKENSPQIESASTPEDQTNNLSANRSVSKHSGLYLPNRNRNRKLRNMGTMAPPSTMPTPRCYFECNRHEEQ